MLYLSIDRDASCTSTNNEREIKITLCRFLRSVYVPILRFLFDWLFEEGKKKIIPRTGKCLMVFGSIHVRPTRERNLESVSSGPVGKTSLHISYVGVHSCASILTSSLSTRFLHSLPQRFSMLVTWYKLVSSCSKLVKLDEDLAAAIFRDLVK